MNNNKKIEISSLGLEENDPKDEDTFHSDLNNLGISEISSKKSESDNETEKEELGIFRNELNKRDKKDYNQKNINNTTKKYKNEIGERNILNISEGTSNNQQQTFEKFQYHRKATVASLDFSLPRSTPRCSCVFFLLIKKTIQKLK